MSSTLRGSDAPSRRRPPANECQQKLMRVVIRRGQLEGAAAGG